MFKKISDTQLTTIQLVCSKLSSFHSLSCHLFQLNVFRSEILLKKLNPTLTTLIQNTRY